ncbi:aldolase [Rossellomorea vietnamensis]|uniref:Aldolase n=1 Tax=Rossellomorea vietnamensis TaxID=218284 RepID=A0A5D4M4B8_9BACI|nr:aldolase/citrate lyase family protein [Rossellomorea vietnamensis]TYR95905.1 aldolase [Rossellomorea vietnamensis]
MTLKLMYITNKAEVAKVAEKSGVDWIFIDLEIKGKIERQGHLDTVISHHHLDDIKKIKGVISKSELLVRVNPIHEGSKTEIDRAIMNGADIVMLPFFQSKNEVEEFIDIIDKRVQTCLLFETPEAVIDIDNILSIDGIDYVHIGLNDLHLGYKKKFMFELLIDGTVEYISTKLKEKGIPFGFGGVARIGQGVLPAEYILAEHNRLGSSMVILSRSFLDLKKKTMTEKELGIAFGKGINELREHETELSRKNEEFYIENQIRVRDIINRQVLIQN